MRIPVISWKGQITKIKKIITKKKINDEFQGSLNKSYPKSIFIVSTWDITLLSVHRLFLLPVYGVIKW